MIQIGLESLIEPGYAIIQAVQEFRNPAADFLFWLLSFMGEELFYLLLIPPLYWLLDKRLATRFSVLFLVSVYFNMLFKGVLDQPRPSPARVEVLLPDPGEGGVPSGHAQNAVVTWGYLASVWPQRWFKAVMVAVIIGIGVSRVYLGVHFPHDVLAGWGIGLLLLLTFFVVAPRVSDWLVRQPIGVQMAAGGAPALLLMLVYQGGAALVAMATLFGLAIGVPLERAKVMMNARWLGGWRSVARLVVGFVGVFLIWRGLRGVLLPLGEPGTFLRYTLLGLWISVGAPWLFVRTGLAGREDPVQPEVPMGVR